MRGRISGVGRRQHIRQHIIARRRIIGQIIGRCHGRIVRGIGVCVRKHNRFGVRIPLAREVPVVTDLLQIVDIGTGREAIRVRLREDRVRGPRHLDHLDAFNRLAAVPRHLREHEVRGAGRVPVHDDLVVRRRVTLEHRAHVHGTAVSGVIAVNRRRGAREAGRGSRREIDRAGRLLETRDFRIRGDIPHRGRIREFQIRRAARDRRCAVPGTAELRCHRGAVRRREIPVHRGAGVKHFRHFGARSGGRHITIQDRCVPEVDRCRRAGRRVNITREDAFTRPHQIEQRFIVFRGKVAVSLHRIGHPELSHGAVRETHVAGKGSCAAAIEIPG